MNRIQLLILNEQIYLHLLDNSLSFEELSSETELLTNLSKDLISEEDNSNNTKLISINDKFKEFSEINKEIYSYLDSNINQIIDSFKETLLSQSSYNRLPKLLVSAYICFVVTTHFEKEKKKLYTNEMLEISKMYLETKFIKMLNSMMDNNES